MGGGRGFWGSVLRVLAARDRNREIAILNLIVVTVHVISGIASSIRDRAMKHCVVVGRGGHRVQSTRLNSFILNIENEATASINPGFEDSRPPQDG